MLVTYQEGLKFLKAGGLIGLGFKELQGHKSNLFIENLKINNIINDHVFLFDINSTNKESNLILGSTDIKTYLGNK